MVNGLCEDSQTWPSAFEVFLETCNHNTKCIIDNMQVMHECKDVKDIEDQCRRSACRQSDHPQWSRSNKTEQLGGEVIQDNLLDHLDSVVNYVSNHQAKMNTNVLECLSELQKSGILLPPTDLHQPGSNSMFVTNEHELALLQGSELEDMWKTAYANCKDTWKWKLCKPSSLPPATELSPNLPQISSFTAASEPSVMSIMPLEQPASTSLVRSYQSGLEY